MSIQTSIRTAFTATSRAIRTYFTSGMVKLNPNHIFGNRRVYAAPESIAGEISRQIGESQPLLREINRILTYKNHALVQAAVVDAELRVVGYGVMYDTFTPHHVGMNDVIHSGVAEFLVGKDPENPSQLRISLVKFPQRHMHYNPYEPEFCFSSTLETIEPNLLHTVQFTINHC